MKFIPRLLLIGFLLFSLQTKVDAGPQKYSDDQLHKMEKIIHQKINTIRQNSGLSNLTWNNQVADTARNHSLNMAMDNFFAHVDSEGKSPGDRAVAAGIAYTNYGENILKIDHPQESLSKLAETVVKGWMGSPRHRGNILKPSFEESGVGIVQDGQKRVFFTQNFLVTGTKIEGTKVNRSDTSLIDAKIESVIRQIHKRGNKPKNIDGLRKVLVQELKKSYRLEENKMLTVSGKKGTEQQNIHLIIDNSVLLSVVGHSSEIKKQITQLAPLVQGRLNYRSLYVVSVSPTTFAHVTERNK